MSVELNENDKKVIAGIRAVVAERGADWVYPRDEDAEDFADWHGVDGHSGACLNLKLDGTGACIIGSLAVNQGLPTARESYAGYDADQWGVSYPVRVAMQEAQQKQDLGATWGVALAAFEEVLAEAGIDV